MENLHTSVMPQEVLEGLNLKPDSWYIDATLGDAGHTLLMLKAGAYVWAIDQDREAIRRSELRITEQLPEIRFDIQTENFHKSQGVRAVMTQTNFEKVSEVAKAIGINKVSGVLMDLGVSTMQLLDSSRGFTFQANAPLDMRMDQNRTVTAADLVNKLPEPELANMFRVLGDEPRANAIAHRIAEQRTKQEITTTDELVEIIGGRRLGHLHPATKVFQALRMAVNSERLVLASALPQMIDLLEPSGRLVVISFHAGEDRIVKQFFKNSEGKLLKIITPHALKPSNEEVTRNPRARSAKLRVAEKI